MNKIVLIFITIGWVIAVQPMQNNGYCKTKDSLDKMRIENLCNNINDVTNDGPLKGDTKSLSLNW